MHPLVRKELREHRGVLIAMLALCILGVLVLLLASLRQGSLLVAWRGMLSIFGPLLALALANRFVVREYGGRTQLFLEILPMSRAQVITVKWLTSAACLLLPMALCFGFILMVASTRVELTPHFVQLLALRGFVFLMFVHALAFFVGLTGRYRYVLWMALVALGFLANSLWQMPPQQWPPMLLVSAAMPFERELAPVQALWMTSGMTLALIAAAFALSLGFQGSWVVALARRMSLREKIIVTSVFLAVVYGIVLVEDRKPKPPFTVLSGSFSAPDKPRVMVAQAEGVSQEVATSLVNQLAADLKALQEYLALDRLPVVAVLPDASIDAELFLPADLPDSDGVVVRAAVGAERYDESAFRAFALGRVLDWYSSGRASRESRRWLLDGFTRWYSGREDPAQHDLLKLRAVAALQAIEPGGPSALAQALQRWLATREQLGDCLADALAWRTAQWLHDSAGDEAFQQLARSLFGKRPASDIRAYLAERPVDALLQGVGAPTIAALAEPLQQAIQAEAAARADRLPSSKWSAAFETVAMPGSLFELRHTLTASTAPIPPHAVRYMRIGPWDGELSRARMERVDATAAGVLPASFARGELLFAAAEVYSPDLQCTVRIGARRWEVQ